MAIVKAVRKAANQTGKVLDAEDRKLLGQGLVLSGGIVVTAGVAGLAIRVFLLAMG